MKTIIFFLTFITFAHAGDGGLVGNGGGAVVCYDPVSNNRAITKSEVLDLYEARVINNQTLDPEILKSGDWKTITRSLIERIGKVSEMRRQLYGMYLDRFDAESKKLSNVNLGDVKDADYVAIPEGCKLEMVILQSKPRITGNARYFINERLWNSLDEFNKAVLVMHELIYREALSYGHANSVRVRLLNGYLLSKEIISLNKPEEIILFFQKLNFEYTDFKFVNIPGGMQQRAGMEIFWDNSNAQGVDRSIVLENRLILNIGKCSPNSCQTFEELTPFRSTSSDDQYLNNVLMMNQEYELTLPDYFQAEAELNSGKSRMIFSYMTDLVFGSSNLDPLNKDQISSVRSVRFIGKLLETLKTNYVNYPAYAFNLSFFLVSNEFNEIEIQSKDQILFSSNTANPMYRIESLNAVNTDSIVKWELNKPRSNYPNVDCLKLNSKDSECSLSIFRATDKIMMGMIFSETDQGIILDKTGEYLTGGKTAEIYSSKHLSQCKDRYKPCIEFVRDVVSNEMYVHSNEIFELNKYLSDSRGIASELIVDVRAGTYPLYQNYNYKWIVIGGDKVFDCEYYSKGKILGSLISGDILFFNEDGTPNVDLSCAKNQNPQIKNLISTSNNSYLNALKGAGL